ncbi:MAG TPA: DUF2254 domain-containing protein [Actinomycetota bacterium]|nr:DUF2254 domain-containing protein [Actinomycetota bacterium]
MGRLRFGTSQPNAGLWFIPFACAVAGIVLSIGTIAIDRALPDELVPRAITGDPNAALIILSTVAASMVSLTALVLTITSVVVQLAMGQFSPRSVRPFLQDRPSQFAIGVFVGAFAHAMFAMREVRSFGQQGFVPGVTICVSYLLVFASVVVLVAYVHHIANALKIDSIIEAVGEETRSTFDRLLEPATDPTQSDPNEISAGEAGVIFRLEHDALIAEAEDADVTLSLEHPVGSFVAEGAPLVRWEGARRPNVEQVRRAIAIGPERRMEQDGAFGVQILVDIVERALSDSFNDQTTAAQGVDRLHDIVRSLAGRQLPTGRFMGSDGRERLVVPEFGWDDYVGIAFDRVIVAAARSPVVLSRLRTALSDLLRVAPPGRRATLQRRLDRVTAAEDDVVDVRGPSERARI